MVTSPRTTRRGEAGHPSRGGGDGPTRGSSSTGGRAPNQDIRRDLAKQRGHHRARAGLAREGGRQRRKEQRLQGPSPESDNVQGICFHERKIPSGAHGTFNWAFFGMSGLALDVQGKHIGFIGDRVSGRHLVPFILPPQNMWAWQKTKYVNNTATFTA